MQEIILKKTRNNEVIFNYATYVRTCNITYSLEHAEERSFLSFFPLSSTKSYISMSQPIPTVLLREQINLLNIYEDS